MVTFAILNSPPRSKNHALAVKAESSSGSLKHRLRGGTNAENTHRRRLQDTYAPTSVVHPTYSPTHVKHPTYRPTEAGGRAAGLSRSAPITPATALAPALTYNPTHVVHPTYSPSDAKPTYSPSIVVRRSAVPSQSASPSQTASTSTKTTPSTSPSKMSLFMSASLSESPSDTPSASPSASLNVCVDVASNCKKKKCKNYSVAEKQKLCKKTCDLCQLSTSPSQSPSEMTESPSIDVVFSTTPSPTPTEATGAGEGGELLFEEVAVIESEIKELEKEEEEITQVNDEDGNGESVAANEEKDTEEGREPEEDKEFIELEIEEYEQLEDEVVKETTDAELEDMEDTN